MTTESVIADPYDAVLADLRAKRDQIDQTIRLLEGMRSGAPAATITQATPPPGGYDEASDGPGAYLGMTIPDAAKKLLATRKQALGNADIYVALTKGGLAMNSAEPLNTIGSVLTRRFNQVGDIVRVRRGVWGLKEWYPNRNFRPATKGAEARAETNGPGQPSEPPPDAPPASSEQP